MQGARDEERWEGEAQSAETEWIDDVGIDDTEDQREISQELVASSTDWRQSLLASYLVAATTSRSQESIEPAERQLIPSPDPGGAP